MILPYDVLKFSGNISLLIGENYDEFVKFFIFAKFSVFVKFVAFVSFVVPSGNEQRGREGEGEEAIYRSKWFSGAMKDAFNFLSKLEEGCRQNFIFAQGQYRLLHAASKFRQIYHFFAKFVEISSILLLVIFGHISIASGP